MNNFLNLKIDNSEIELSNFKEYSNIGEVLNKLIILSKSGNELLLELYNKINECFENITSLISDKYLNLINIISYNDLSEIFDSTLSLENLLNVPISILNESSSLSNNLLSIYNEVDNGNNFNILNKNINDYVENCHILVNNIFNKEFFSIFKFFKK